VQNLWEKPLPQEDKSLTETSRKGLPFYAGDPFSASRSGSFSEPVWAGKRTNNFSRVK
jgi:hypothetical protein